MIEALDIAVIIFVASAILLLAAYVSSILQDNYILARLNGMNLCYHYESAGNRTQEVCV